MNTKKTSPDSSTKEQTLGEFLRTIRMSIPLTLREAEEASGVSNAYLSQLESGKISRPSPPFLHKLATAYQISYEALMEKAGYVSKDAAPRLTGRLATLADKKLTPEEEQALLSFLGYMRSQKKG
jgi:HTH-type transcriptional regulator, competence development regulator